MANAFLDLTGTPALIATGSNDLRIGCSGTGTTKFFNSGAVNGAFASSGLILGGSTNVSGITNAPLEVQVNGDAVNGVKIVGYSTTANNAATLLLGRTKGAAAATNTIVASGDVLGDIKFQGANGTSYTTAASIKAIVDGTPGASADMPGRLEIYTTPDGSGTQLRRFFIDAAGVLNQDATNGSNIVLTKASTSVCQPVANAVSAAGTTIADATQLTAVINRVSTVAASTGVKLWDATIGTTIYVMNLGASDLELYPPDANGVINSAAAGVAVTLAAATNQIAICSKTAANTWIVMVGAGPDT